MNLNLALMLILTKQRLNSATHQRGKFRVIGVVVRDRFKRRWPHSNLESVCGKLTSQLREGNKSRALNETEMRQTEREIHQQEPELTQLSNATKYRVTNAKTIHVLFQH